MRQHLEYACAVCGKNLPDGKGKLLPDDFKIICEPCLSKTPKVKK
jgi:DNA-directed RNA polymerase subunit RPC12/RpoP